MGIILLGSQPGRSTGGNFRYGLRRINTSNPTGTPSWPDPRWFSVFNGNHGQTNPLSGYTKALLAQTMDRMKVDIR